MIEFRGLEKSFGSHKVLDRIDLRIREGEITYIIGTSGTGKSVLVKHAVGLLRPDAGRVIVEGEDVTDAPESRWRALRLRHVLVFQQSTLFDWMTLLENVALPLRKHRGLSRREASERAKEYLALVDMLQKADFMPYQVGPGERKKVAIARALTLEPVCTILDEPTTGLDMIASAAVDNLIRRLAQELGRTVIVVSHDLRSIFGVADRIVFLYKKRVWLDGTPRDFLCSKDPVVQQFIRGEPEGPIE